MKIVIRAPNWLGDVVLSLAAVRDIREAHIGANLSVLARPSVAAIYEAVKGVDETILAQDFSSEVRALREGRFDRGFLLPNSIGTALAFALGNVGERLGYATQRRGLLLTRAITVDPSVRNQTQVNYYRAMLRGLGVATSAPADSSLACPEAWCETARALVGTNAPLIGLAPGAAKGTAKQWPPERFAHVADSLSREWSCGVVLLGSNADRGACDEVARAMTVEPMNLCGKTSLREFVGVISLLKGLVANDSGAMHVSAALGVPTVGVFGPTNARETAPVGGRATLVRGVAECAPCRHATCPIDHRCMKSIAPDAVVQEMRRVAA